MSIGFPEFAVILIIFLICFGIISRESLRNVLKEARQIMKNTSGTPEQRPPIEETLSIFLSSSMNPINGGLQFERNIIKTILTNERLFSLWRFEDSPAEDELKESYINKVKQCDIFVIVVGETMPLPVKQEFEEALMSKKPILAFIKEGVKRSSEAESFILSLSQNNIKYKGFQTQKELEREVLRAVFHCVIKYYRSSLSSKNYFSMVFLLYLLEDEFDMEDIYKIYDKGRGLDSYTEILNKLPERTRSGIMKDNLKIQLENDVSINPPVIPLRITTDAIKKLRKRIR